MREMLEEKLERAQRRKDKLFHHRRRFDSKDMDQDLPPFFLRRVRRQHQQIEGERQYKPRSDYTLHVVGIPEFTEDGTHEIRAEDRCSFYNFAAGLPADAQEILVDYGLLRIHNPNSSKPFQRTEKQTRSTVQFRGTEKRGYKIPKIVEYTIERYHTASKYDIAKGLSDWGFIIPISPITAEQLYETCKDDVRALELLQDYGVIQGVVERRRIERAAAFFGLDGELCDRAYVNAYNNPRTRTYAPKAVLSFKEHQRKTKQF